LPDVIFQIVIVFLAFDLGERVDIVCGFANNGDEAFNITGISAALLWPYDLSVYIQNVGFLITSTSVFRIFLRSL
jgi:hypothetical protein